MDIIKSTLFFPASAYLTDKWWHRLATVALWLWVSLASGIVSIFAVLLIWVIASKIDPSISYTFGNMTDPMYFFGVIILWAALAFAPSVAYRTVLFVTKGSAWKDVGNAA